MQKVVTTSELETILNNTPNSIGTFASITQVTEPKITKKDRVTKEPTKFSKVVKVSKLSILLNTDYESSVKNRLKKENKDAESFVVGKNTMPIELSENNNFFGYYNGKAVLQYRPMQNSKPTTKFLADGKITDKENLGDILPKVYVNKNQGTETEIAWRKLYLSNVKRLVLNKIEYVVKN
jgi:hypothetical protein